MPIKSEDKPIYLDPNQLDLAARFIARHNPTGFSFEYVKNSIVNNIQQYIHSETGFVGTMGYTIQFVEEDTAIDVGILVDPSLGAGRHVKEYKSIKKLVKKVME